MDTLDTTLRRLVADGTLTEPQAQAVRDGVAPTQPQVGQRNPAPEIIGYVGAALILSAALNLVMQQWEQWSPGLRLGVALGAAVAVYAAALAVSATAGWRRGLASGEQEMRRRLVGVLVAVAVPLVGLTVTTALTLSTPEPPRPTQLIVGAAAALAGACGAWWVRGAMTTLGMAAGALWLSVAVIDVVMFERPEWILPVIVVAGGGAWLVLAPRLLGVPVLAEALGVAWLVVGLSIDATNSLSMPRDVDMPDQWVGPPPDIVTATWVARLMLIAFAVIALIRFARGASWPWAAGGITAGVIAALAIGEGAFGWIAGLFVAGVVLLALSGVLLAVRRRRESHMRSGASTPQSSRPFAST